MNQATLISVLYYVIPLTSGASLSAIGLAKKYPTVKRYVYTSWSAWLYILVSAAGALLITVTTRALGTRVIEHETLNCIFQSLLGAGIFVGIITRWSIPGDSKNEVGAQLITIRDYLYEFLDASIARRVMQEVESAIKDLGKNVGNDYLLKEATRLIGGPPQLTTEQKDKIRLKFDEYATVGDYSSIIRTLIVYYDVDYIIKELSTHSSTF